MISTRSFEFYRSSEVNLELLELNGEEATVVVSRFPVHEFCLLEAEVYDLDADEKEQRCRNACMWDGVMISSKEITNEEAQELYSRFGNKEDSVDFVNGTFCVDQDICNRKWLAQRGESLPLCEIK